MGSLKNHAKPYSSLISNAVVIKLHKIDQFMALNKTYTPRPTQKIMCYRSSPIFFLQFSPPQVFFMILAQIHALYDTEKLFAPLRMTSALFRVSSTRSAEIFC